MLVPYLEKAGAKENSDGTSGAQNNSGRAKNGTRLLELVAFERPAQNRRLLSAVTEYDGESFLFLGVKDEEVADYHYTFYVNIAELIARRSGSPALDRFSELLRSELKSDTHGEIDEKSWRMKEQLIRRQSDLGRDTKLRQSYFRQALEDTLTLYLHGLCCDIDVDIGPAAVGQPPHPAPPRAVTRALAAARRFRAVPRRAAGAPQVAQEIMHTEQELDEALSRPTPADRSGDGRNGGRPADSGRFGQDGPQHGRAGAARLRAGRRFQTHPRARRAFPTRLSRQLIEAQGIETMVCDLLDRASIEQLPDCPNVLFMAGQKFGTASRQTGPHVGDQHLRAGDCRRAFRVTRASWRSRRATSIRLRRSPTAVRSKPMPPGR